MKFRCAALEFLGNPDVVKPMGRYVWLSFLLLNRSSPVWLGLKGLEITIKLGPEDQLRV